MKNLTILSIFLFCSCSAFAQSLWEWSSPKALSSNTTDNQHVCFLSMDHNPIAVWEKVINETTYAICSKDFTNPYATERFLVQKEGVKYTNPTGIGNLIMFEANDGSNSIKLQYIIVYHDSVSKPKDICNQSGDQTNPKMSYNYVFWINNGAVFVAYYTDYNFTSPIKLSSSGVYSMDAIGHVCTYVQYQGIQSLFRSKGVQYSNNKWQISSYDSIIMNFRLTDIDVDNMTAGQWCSVIETGVQEGSIMYTEHTNGQLHYYKTGYNMVEPTIEYYEYHYDNDLHAVDFLAFSGDSTGNFEIYAYAPGEGLRNISNFYANDRNPKFFPTWEAYQQIFAIRLYLVWEAEWPGYKTLYYSSLLYPVAGENHKLEEHISINVTPNPLSTQTIITFPVMQNPVVKIYSMQGKEIRNFSGFVYANSNEQVFWDGKDNSGKSVPAGNYLVVVQGDKGVNSTVIVKK